MKKMITVLSLLITIGVVIGFIGCTIEDITENENQMEDFENPYKFVGEIHNSILNNFHENYPDLTENENRGLLSIGTYYEITSIAKEYLIDSLNVEESTVDAELEKVYILFEEANLWIEIDGEIYLENFMTYDNVLILLEKAINNGLIQNNVNELFPSIEANFNGASIDEIKLIINSLPKESYDPEIMEPALMAIAVFEYSYEYWLDYDNQQRFTSTGAIILADMVGGLIGGHGGWVGGVLGAGLFSYFYNDIFVEEH